METRLLLGHRGAPLLARENTLESFALALQSGLDGVELDVQRSRDGVLVIHHDFDLEGAPIAELDWSELRRRAPWMPRLEEVFELFEAYPKAWINLELKAQPPLSDGRERDLARQLGSWSGKSRVWVSSFDPLALIRLRREGLEVPLALLCAQEEVLELLPCLGVQGVHPHHSLLSRQRVERFVEQGYFVVTWTVNEAHRARELLRWGVRGVIGDVPDELKAAREGLS
jgi:glycerophosphoryl diester phosphodiesterase